MIFFCIIFGGSGGRVVEMISTFYFQKDSSVLLWGKGRWEVGSLLWTLVPYRAGLQGRCRSLFFLLRIKEPARSG